MSTEVAGADAPHVKGKFIGILVCWLLGNGSLFAWNSILTIEDYYSHLFPDYHPTRVLTLAYQPFAFGITLIMTLYEAKMNTRLRNLAGFSLFFLGSFALIILDVATKGHGGLGVFIGVCIISAIFGTADANCQGALVGDLSLMCPEFVQSFMAGLAASGVLTSALRLITKASFESSKDGLRIGALLFFSITCLFELVCLLLYTFVFAKLPIVKYYRSKAAAEGSKTVVSDLTAAGVTEQLSQVEEDPQKYKRLSTKELFMENIDYALDIYLIYVLTLSIFPGFLSEDTGEHNLGTWYALVLIAMYNVWDLIGRYVPLIPCLKLTSRKGIMAAILARFLFIPAFYFTANYGDQGYMIFLTSFLGLTNGYLTVCVLMEAPKGYNGPEQNALGNVLVVCLLGGLFSGVVLDWLWLIGKGCLDVLCETNLLSLGKYFGLLVCFVLGNGCLFSWNSMLTIEDYYVYLFPKNHPTRVLTLVYQPFALGVTALLTYHEAKINTRLRNVTGYTLFFLSSFAIIMLDVATKGQGGVGVFVGVCVIGAAFGTADAHVQGGMVGDLSMMCPEFIQSYLAGLAASGAITSALRLITKAAFENSRDGLRKGAMLFFSISCFFELLCVLLYAFVFPTLPIVKYYRSKAASEGSKTVAGDLAAAGVPAQHDEQVEEDPKRYERLSTKKLLQQNMDYALDIFLIYVLTLSIFPGFLSEDTGLHNLGTWYALVLIAIYNVWDLIGRYVPFIIKLKSRKCIMAAALARFLLIPAFYFIAKYGNQGYMIFLTSFLGLGNGYLTGPEQNALGNVLVVFLLIGLFSGVVLDWLWLIGKGPVCVPNSLTWSSSKAWHLLEKKQPNHSMTL
ncbi:hypothetical protein U9M48_015574 [Paspalum notatum var. saurae]|uniref:Equilibrative nucleoside transporter n=1 Tax=Paspalum notatum var. saurae TaxID=547442 RepID=A0AAQ3T544_PASNO